MVIRLSRKLDAKLKYVSLDTLPLVEKRMLGIGEAQEAVSILSVNLLLALRGIDTSLI